MSVRDVIALLVLAAMWGASFLFIRIGAPALGPFVLIELRVLLASITLFAFTLAMRHRVHIMHKWWQYLVLGTVNAALPFTLISFAELRLDAGLAAILNATTPMFTALVAWLWVRDPFTLKKLTGVLLGIVGVGVLVGWSSDNGAHLWLAVAFSLLAAICYAAAGVFAGLYFKGEKPMDMAIGQQLASTLVLLPFGLGTLPHAMPSAAVIVSVLGLAIICTAVAYLIFFDLLHRVGALKALTVTFLVPAFGVIWGNLFLGEPITMRLVLGLIIILSSVALVANVHLRRRQPA